MNKEKLKKRDIFTFTIDTFGSKQCMVSIKYLVNISKINERVFSFRIILLIDKQ